MTYADDITITSTHTNTSAANKYIQPYLHKVIAWINQNNLHSVHSRPYSSTRHNTNRKHNKHTTYFNTPRLKNTIFNKGRYTTKIPTDLHTVTTTTDKKTNMCHIHAFIVSRHLATRGNNKILRTPPPNISSSVQILPTLLGAPLLNSEQINRPS